MGSREPRASRIGDIVFVRGVVFHREGLGARFSETRSGVLLPQRCCEAGPCAARPSTSAENEPLSTLGSTTRRNTRFG